MNPFTARPWIFWLLLAAGVFLFIGAIKAILLPFIVGLLIAYFLDPVADRLERMGTSRTFASAYIILLFFGGLGGALLWLVPTLVAQSDDLIRAVPSYLEQLRGWGEQMMVRYSGLIENGKLEQAKQVVNGSSQEVTGVIGPLLKGLLSSGAALINLGALIVLSPIVSFYLLRDWDHIISKIDELLPQQYAATIREQAAQIDRTLAGYVRGMFNVMLILTIFYAIGLSLVGLNFAVLIALLGGVAIIIPYMGTVVSGSAAVGMAYMQFDTLEPVAVTLGIFTAGQMLEGYILTPKLVGDKIGLHPLWLIFGMLAGGALFGFVGVLLAIPVTAILGVLIRFAIQRYRQSSYYTANKTA